MEIVKGNLYKSKEKDLIVMAEKETRDSAFSGQVVVDGLWVKGHYSEDWSKDCFEPYSAEIILKEVIDFSKVQFLEMNDGEIVLTSGNTDGLLFSGHTINDYKYITPFKSDVKKVVTPNFT